ncbi:hypothetical protein [Nocardia rhizosphaerae]|uniref:Uncharacterized protein n=1 Tax=Nocardia rhizosphaerae TaxID=1691571 RepID=A0ABV8LCT3_9NOCA
MKEGTWRIESTPMLWAETFDGVNNVEARQQLTCAENRYFKAPEASAGNSSAGTRGTEIDVHSGTGEMYISPGLDAAYAEATITLWDIAARGLRAEPDTDHLKVGFEMRKENGSWKVCDWGSENSGSDSPMLRNRFTLLGWKLSGPPS